LSKSRAEDLCPRTFSQQKIERFTQVKANQIITIREGSGIISTADKKK